MTDKILTENSLRDLIDHFSKNDVISHIEKNYKQENIKYLSYVDIIDNKFLKGVRVDNRFIETVKKSVIDNGLYTPLIITKSKTPGKYEVLIGRKRWIACQKLKLTKIPVIIKEYTDEEILLVSLCDASENKTVNPIEIARIIYYLNKDYGYKKGKIAQILHQSEAQISSYLGLLKLPKEVIKDVSRNKLSFGHAKTLYRLPDDKVLELVNRIYNENLSVRELENIVKTIQHTNKELDSYSYINDNKIIVRLKDETKLNEVKEKIDKILKKY